jgi:acyl carrier protein
MNAADLREKLFEIIRSVFAQPDLQVGDDTTAADVSGWDSFNHMNLVMRIEEEFGIAFETEEIGRLGRVGDLVELTRQKLGSRTA